MRKVLGMAAAGLAVAFLAGAQTQVGTVTSTAPFRLRGATITPGEGVPMWPVLPGDVVTAGGARTIVTFADGSSVSLEPGTEGNFDLSGSTPLFQLASGTVVYSLKSKTSVKLLSGDKTVTPVNLSGSYSRTSQKSVTGGFWTPTHTALVVGGVAAATAAGLGVGAAEASGSQVSPSH